MKTIIPIFDLNRFLQQTSDRIGLIGDLTVNRPHEAAVLAAVSISDLTSASARHGLNVVRRMGGKIFDFTRRHN